LYIYIYISHNVLAYFYIMVTFIYKMLRLHRLSSVITIKINTKTNLLAYKP